MNVVSLFSMIRGHCRSPSAGCCSASSVPLLARRLDEGEILLGKLQNRNARKIDLLPPRELQQQVERPLEALDIDRERRFVERPIDLETFFDHWRAQRAPEFCPPDSHVATLACAPGRRKAR